MKPITYASFKREHGLPPRKWASVLSIAGCATDEVPGVPGVGKVTALKFLRGELSVTSKAYEKITSVDGKAIRRRNKQLVKLPLEGVQHFQLDPDQTIDPKGWDEVITELGFRSFDSMPTARRKRKNATNKGFNLDAV